MQGVLQALYACDSCSRKIALQFLFSCLLMCIFTIFESCFFPFSKKLHIIMKLFQSITIFIYSFFPHHTSACNIATLHNFLYSFVAHLSDLISMLYIYIYQFVIILIYIIFTYLFYNIKEFLNLKNYAHLISVKVKSRK